MTLDHAALLQVLEAMKVAEVDGRIKMAAETIYQALIDAELTDAAQLGPASSATVGPSWVDIATPRFEAITVAVCGSLGRRSSLENRIRALSALSGLSATQSP
jgi:hypothetical protein